MWFREKCKLAKKESNSSAYSFRNGILVKLVGETFCPVIPTDDDALIRVILEDLHASALGGHMGPKKMLSLLQKRVYWLNMHQTILKFCRECIVC